MKPSIEITEKTKDYQNLLTLLQKNNNLNYLGEFKKQLNKLSANQDELEKLSLSYNKDYSTVFKDHENQRNILINSLQKVTALINLIVEASNSKKIKERAGFLLKNWEDITDKKLVKYSQKTIILANKLGGYSIFPMDNTSPKKVNKKLTKAAEIKDNFGLTDKMVKDLEDTASAFMKSMAFVDLIVEEKIKTQKQIKKLFDKNEKIITRKIDMFVNVYESSNSSFSSLYNKTRDQLLKEDAVKNAKSYSIV